MSLLTGLVSYWKMDESSDGSGAVTRNDSHGSNNLTDNNTTPSGSGIINNGANFQVANSEYLSITDAAQSGLDITGDLSISVWVKFTSTTEVVTFVDKTGGNTAGQRAYFFDYYAGSLAFLNSADGTANSQQTVAWSPSTAIWYHVAVTFESSTKAKKFYVDGSQQGTTQTGVYTGIFNSAAPFNIGYYAEAPGYYTNAVLDEHGIWSRVLTGAEITSLYNGGVGLSYDDFGGGGTVFPQPTLLTLGLG